jgi:S-adenosylmethionine uptake transporter
MITRPAVSGSTTLRAYGAAMAGIALFSIMDMVMKGLTIAQGAYATMLFRSLVGVLLAGTVFAAGKPRLPPQPVLRLHLVRGFVTSIMAVLFFWGLARVPMAQAVALTFIAPLIALALARVVLDEPLGRGTIGGSLFASAGVAVIFFGQAQGDLGRGALLGSAAVIASAVIYAWNIILMRQQALIAKPSEIAFFQSLAVVVVLLLAVPIMGVPALEHVPWFQVVLAAALGFGSQLLLAWAYARAGAAYLSTTEYLSFVWAMLLGWLRFGEHVSLFTLGGAVLILAGCWIAARGKQIAHPTLESAA